MSTSGCEFEYDFTVSFADEDRELAARFARLLHGEGIRVFYDEWNTADLWGTDLVQHLNEVYSKKARFCVIFISAAYLAKRWTIHELKSAQARALQDSATYILPVRLDETVIPGIPRTIGEIDLSRITIEEAAKLAAQKINSEKLRVGAVSDKAAAADTARTSASTVPRLGKVAIRKQFTQHDVDTFVEKAYDEVARFFKESLERLRVDHESLEGEFRQVTAIHFTARVYRRGSRINECGIRLVDGFFGKKEKQIIYSRDPESTNSMDKGVRVADDGEEMFLTPSVIFDTTRGLRVEEERLTPHEAAEMFWGILVSPLQR